MGLAYARKIKSKINNRSKARSRSRSRTGSLLKNFVFYQLLSVSKSCGALALITRTAPVTVPLHPWTFPSRECGGVLSVPENQKRVEQWWGCLPPLCPSRNACSGLWWADRGRLTWLAGFMAKRVKWPNNDRREALGHSIAHHDPTELPHLQDASPLGSGSFPRFSLCWLTASRRPSV